MNNYKIKNKLNLDEDIEIEKNIYNINNIIRMAYNSLRLYNNYNNNFEDNILNWKVNEFNIVSKLTVNFKRKNINYKKSIYIIMTKEMEQNITEENNIRYFSDTTYYAIPPNKFNYKIFWILAFNNKLHKAILCNISIISNENKETFITKINIIFYLKSILQIIQMH